MVDASTPLRFRDEVRLIARRFVEVWRLVPRKHKKALGAATLVMAVTSGRGPLAQRPPEHELEAHETISSKPP